MASTSIHKKKGSKIRPILKQVQIFHHPPEFTTNNYQDWGARELQAATDESQAVSIVMEMGIDGRITYLSPSLKTVFGYDPRNFVVTAESEYLGVPFLPPGAMDSNLFENAIQELLADNNVTVEIKYAARTCDGVWLEMEAKVYIC
jgi:PAS domain-containing protein